MIKLIFRRFLLAAVLGLMGNVSAGGPDIVIGTLQDLSGPLAPLGVHLRNGMQMRVDEANAQGGVHGRKLRLVVEDTGYDPRKAVLATEVFGESNQSNPHQEYLLWGVELGVGGLLLFVAALVCVARDALLFPQAIKRATLAVLVAIAIACMFNSALYDDLMGDFLVVAMGLLMALGTRSMAIGHPRMKGNA